MKIQKSKKIKHYDFSRKPLKPIPLIFLVHLLTFFKNLFRPIKITKSPNKQKRPRLILGNHGAFNDFYLLFKTIKSPHINYVVALDAFNDINDVVMRMIGSICKRKFISDLSLMKNLKYCATKLKNNIVIYPEARYSLDGTTSYLPQSLGKLVKYLNLPVSILMSKGNYISDPQWNKYKQNSMPMEAELTEIITEDEISKLSVKEINERIQKNFVYDDFKWLKESGIKLKYKNRAYNLNAILYQCPNCKTEFKMQGEGTTLKCLACEKEWEMLEDGSLKAKNGVTEFSHIPDWFKWERQNVHEEVFSGKYKMEYECKVYTLPHCHGFVPQANGTFIQNSEKTILKVNLYGEDKVIEYTGNELESVHIEYNYKGEGDMLDFSIRGDSIWMNPLGAKDVITKISLATEEIRDLRKLKN